MIAIGPLERKRRVVIVVTTLLVVGFAVAGFFLVSHPRVAYTPQIIFCRPLYQRARNAVDTSQADATVPISTTQGRATNPVRCGELRAANLLDDTTASR